MSRIPKLLKTLCRQGTVLALMALATSGLATDAEATGLAPPETDKVKFDSSTAERFKTEVILDWPHDSELDVKFTFESSAGHDSNVYCNHRAWVIDWKIGIDNHYGPIEFPFTSKKKKYTLPITLCRRGIGKTFKVVWSAKGDPFDEDAKNCWSSASCYTEVTIEDVGADITAPRVTSITRQSPTTSPTDANSLTWRVTFDEAVQNVDKADFQVSGTTATLSVSAISTSVYDVTASGGDLADLNGTVTLGFNSSHNIQDTSGNELTNLTRTGANDNTFVVENTAAQPAITIAGGSAVTEGTAASFALTASPAPTANLTVNLTVSESDDFVADNDEGTKTVTIGTSGTATYTVPTVNDNTDEANGSVKVTVNEGSGYTVDGTEPAKVTVNDNDTRGLVLNPTSLTVNEGSSASYTVKLATKPTAEVTVTVGGTGSGITVDTDTSTVGDQDTLTFTASNWDQTQSVRVSAGQDANTADESVTLTHTTSGGDYGTNPVSKNLVVTADDTTTPATPTLSLIGPDSANEGDSDTRDLTYTVRLTSAISSGLVVWEVCFGGTATGDTDGGAIDGNADYQPRSGNSAYRGTGCFSQAFNTSSSALSNTHLKIRVKGDTVVEQDETVIATLTITDNTAGVALGTATHTHTIRDDDGGTVADTTAPRVISITRQTPSSSPTDADSLTWRVTFDEAVQNVDAADFKLTGTTASLSVLEISNSVFDVTASGGDLAGLNGEVRLGFDSSHSIEDKSGNRLSNLTRTGANDNTFEVRNTATTPFLVLSKNTLNVAEGGTGNYTVNLATEPTGTVTVAIASNNTDVTASPTSLTFHASSGSKPWNTAQTVTVSAGQDGDDADESATLAHTSSGGGYGSVTGSVTVTVNDDDITTTTSTSSSDGVRSFSIDDATAMEKDGTINFTVRLSAATQGNSQASVRVATRDVTAVSGLDYRSRDTNVVFQSGETTKVVKVELINDAHNEGAETFEVVLSNPSNAVIGDGVATGTINNADYVPQSELAHFGRSVANHVLEGVIDRISSPRSPGASARIAGNVVGKADRAPDPDCPGCGVLSTDRRVEKFDREEILTDSSFVLNGQDDSSHSPAFWGRGTRSYFRDKPGNLSVDGEVTSFILGADLGWSDRKIVGLALIRSSGKIDHMEKPGVEDPNTGMTKLTLTALVPYAGWKINDSIDVWGALGHGNGKMELDLNAGDTSEMIKTSFDWTMAAAGLRGDVVRPGPDGGPQLTALLDGYRVKTSSKETEGLAASKASVTRLRAGLEASWEMQLEDGSILVPRMETNLIQEIGDVGSGFGLELVGGLSWSDPDTGLAVDLSARRLRSHDSPGRKDHGYSMALVYDPNPESERGLSVSMRQDRGNSESTMDGLLTSGLPETTAEDSISSQWTTELAYGFPVIDGSFTGSPHAGIEETDDYRDYKVGWRLTPAGPQAPDLSFDINAARRERLLSNSADHRLGVGLVAEW